MDTTDVIAFILLIVFIAAIVVFGLYDIVIAFLLQKILEPAVKWIQRVFFGIDRARTGDEALIGSSAIAGQFEPAGTSGFIGSVLAEGERWSARSDSPVEPGAAVSVVGRENLLLVIEPLESG